MRAFPISICAKAPDDEASAVGLAAASLAFAALGTAAVAIGVWRWQTAFMRRASQGRDGGRRDRAARAWPRTLATYFSGDLDGADRIGPYSRNTFSMVLEHRLAELRRNRVPLSIVLARLDNYPKICDLYGPHAGSLVLQAAAKFFVAAVREMDWVARFDPNTFAILLPGANLRNAQGVAERLRAGVAGASLSVDRRPLVVTIVTGTAEATCDDDADTLLQRAEAATQVPPPAGGLHTRSDTAPGQPALLENVVPG